jgi:hypothetical protein
VHESENPNVVRGGRRVYKNRPDSSHFRKNPVIDINSKNILRNLIAS